jgi:hypothetical protein
MVANGVSLRAVQTIGGLTSLRMVERYAYVDDAELARAVRVTHQHAETAAGATKRATATTTATGQASNTNGAKS